MTDDLTELKVAIGVLASEMKSAREDIGELREDIKRANQNNVTRAEWQQRNTELDNRFAGHGREISEIRSDIKAQRVPLTGIAAITISALVLAWQILGPIITNGR